MASNKIKFSWSWWMIYHGDENPFKIMKELKTKGYHDCHDCPNPLHPQNRKEFK